MRVVLALVCVGGLLVAAFFLGRESVTLPPTTKAAAPQGVPSVPRPPEDTLLQRDDAIVVRRPVTEPTEPVEPSAQKSQSVSVRDALNLLRKALKDDTSHVYGAENLEAKYAEMSLPELQVVATALQRMESETRDRLISQRFDDGLYETATADKPRTIESGGGKPAAAMGTRQEVRNGELVTLTTTISGVEYPEYAHVSAEMNWVRSRVRSLSATSPK